MALPDPSAKILPIISNTPASIGQQPDDVSLKKPSAPPVGFTPSVSGERKEAAVKGKEKVPIVERVPPKELEPEVKDWMTKLETGEEIQLPQPITDDAGQPLVSPPAPQQVAVTLPLTEEEMSVGLHRKVIESIRWLAEWMKRVLKIAGGKFVYRIKK